MNMNHLQGPVVPPPPHCLISPPVILTLSLPEPGNLRMQINLRGGRAVERNINYICMGFEVCVFVCVDGRPGVGVRKKQGAFIFLPIKVHDQSKVWTNYPM